MRRVLLVDDELIEIEYLKSIFSKHQKKYTLIGKATNGEQAIKIALEQNPDVIIMDINIPVIDGLEAARMIKKVHENTIVILNSAYSEFDFAQRALNYKLDSYLLKPANEKEILDSIDSAFNAKNNMVNPSIKNKNEEYNQYPYELIDNLAFSIQTRDLKLLDMNRKYYIDYLKINMSKSNENRIFIINTIFSVERIVEQTYSKDMGCLLKCERYIDEINKVKGFYNVFITLENFFEDVRRLVESHNISRNNVTDLLEKYLAKNYKEHIGLEKLSEIFHFSPSYLSRKFREDKGVTINNYLISKRIEYSKQLLKNSRIPIGEIGFKAGYNNISHFNRVFKKQTGKTPRQYRQEV